MEHIYCIKKNLANALKMIDIYGRKTNLTLNHEISYKTAFGGFSTLIIVVLFLLLFLNFGSDMIYHQNPSNISSEIYSKLPEKQYFSKEDFFFMFGVQGPNYAHFIDNTIYTVNFKHTSSNKIDSNQSFSRDIELERCTEAHLPTNPELKQYFLEASGSPIEDLLCVKDLDKFFMEGAFDSNIYTYLKMTIKVCVNQTDKENSTICKPIEEIKTKLSGYFALYSVDYLIDPQNFEKPGQAIGKDYFSPISVGMTRNTGRYIETSKVNSDDGFLFAAKNYFKYPTISNDKETLLNDPNNSNLIVFSLRKSHSDHVYERSYKKIQRCLAEIGGFVNIIYIFFWILNYPFVSKKYFEKIVNMIYNFEGDKENRYVQIGKRIHLKTKAFASSIKQKKMVETSKQNLTKYMEKIKNGQPLKMGYCEYFKSILFPNKKKQKNYQNKFKRLMAGKHVVEEKLDIGYLLKKFYEIDKLKMILLNENQYNLFDYLPKPVILKNAKIDLGNPKSNLKIMESDNMMNKAKKLYNSFQSIIKQNELSLIDKKLIDLLDENVRNLLESKSDLFQENQILKQLDFSKNK